MLYIVFVMKGHVFLCPPHSSLQLHLDVCKPYLIPHISYVYMCGLFLLYYTGDCLGWVVITLIGCIFDVYVLLIRHVYILEWLCTEHNEIDSFALTTRLGGEGWSGGHGTWDGSRGKSQLR